MSVMRKVCNRPSLKVAFLLVTIASLIVSFFSSNWRKRSSTWKRGLRQQMILEHVFIEDRFDVKTNVSTVASSETMSPLIVQKPGIQISGIESKDVTVQNAYAFDFPIPAIDEILAASGDLVLGMAQGIPEPNLAVFVMSLRQFSACHIVFFMDVVSERANSIVSAYNVTAIPINMEHVPPEMRSFHPSTLRWMMKNNFMKKHGTLYKRVLLADVRDTVFQGDPFEIVKSPGYYIFKEKVLFANEGWNKGWVKDCFGDEMVEKLSPNLVVCSGISMGTADAVALYLALMTSTMSTVDFAKCERNGVDQGVHNVLSYTNRIPVIHSFLQSDGPVAHMQNTDMQVLPDWSVKAPDSAELVRVVHQYDRNKALQNHLFRKYVTWDIYEQLNGTGACEGYILKKNVEMFKGLGDFEGNQVAATDAAACCKSCNQNARCKAFTHIPGGGCWLKDYSMRGPPDVMETVPNAVGGWRPIS